MSRKKKKVTPVFVQISKFLALYYFYELKNRQNVIYQSHSTSWDIPHRISENLFPSNYDNSYASKSNLL